MTRPEPRIDPRPDLPTRPSRRVRPPRAARRRGTSAVEYALIAGLVACGLGSALVEFGPPLHKTFAAFEQALGGSMPPSLGIMPGPLAPEGNSPPPHQDGGGGGGGMAPSGPGGSSTF